MLTPTPNQRRESNTRRTIVVSKRGSDAAFLRRTQKSGRPDNSIGTSISASVITIALRKMPDLELFPKPGKI
jgi:hypothetical protein